MLTQLFPWSVVAYARHTLLGLLLLGEFGAAWAQDPCNLFPWDLLPAPIQKRIVLANLDLDGDASTDCVFRANGDNASTTVFKLDYAEARDRCVTLAAEATRAGYQEFERVGQAGQLPYASPGTFAGIAIQIQTWVNVCEPDPYGCFQYAAPDPAREFVTNTVAFLGVRLTKTDGDHFGWVKFSRPCNKAWVPFELESFALHPLPNTPIPAGVVPQPELVVERGPGTVTLSWRPEWQGYRLEWVQQLEPDVAWKPVAGVVDHRVTLPASSATGYFRLTKSP